ncbi:MAG TPA: cytochrome C oxidase subunit IV family protein [Opitutaceae bacterium]|nr:cytochrome C oxidase subunit IV family protein [Opitutaceae bacterium]
MSDTASSAHAVGPAHGESKFHIFVQLAMILAVITGVEIVMVYLPFAYAVIFTILVVLSAVKFLCVIFYFMHLRWDKAFCTILFFIGLILAGGTMWVLLRVFSVADSKPLTSSFNRAPPAAETIWTA